jgi:hypothetical protein
VGTSGGLSLTVTDASAAWNSWEYLESPNNLSVQGGLGSIPCHVIWDLWWAVWQYSWFSSSASGFPASSDSTNCSVFIVCLATDAVWSLYGLCH